MDIVRNGKRKKAKSMKGIKRSEKVRFFWNPPLHVFHSVSTNCINLNTSLNNNVDSFWCSKSLLTVASTMKQIGRFTWRLHNLQWMKMVRFQVLNENWKFYLCKVSTNIVYSFTQELIQYLMRNTYKMKYHTFQYYSYCPVNYSWILKFIDCRILYHFFDKLRHWNEMSTNKRFFIFRKDA